MKYMIRYRIPRENLTKVLTRFKQGGALPPEDVKLLGRWTEAALQGGFALVQTENAAALTGYLMDWADLYEHEVVPVIEDEEIQANL